MMNPVHAAPNNKRLARIYTKVVYFGIVFIWIQFCFRKPIFWKFFFTIRHVLAAKNAKSKHLFWRQFWLEDGIKVFSFWFY